MNFKKKVIEAFGKLCIYESMPDKEGEKIQTLLRDYIKHLLLWEWNDFVEKGKAEKNVLNIMSSYSHTLAENLNEIKKIKEYFNNEKFIDKIIERINKKQLK